MSTNYREHDNLVSRDPSFKSVMKKIENGAEKVISTAGQVAGVVGQVMSIKNGWKGKRDGDGLIIEAREVLSERESQA